MASWHRSGQVCQGTLLTTLRFSLRLVLHRLILGDQFDDLQEACKQASIRGRPLGGRDSPGGR